LSREEVGQLSCCQLTRVFALAISITMLLKSISYSTNPLWCIVFGPANHLGLFLAILAVVEYACRPDDPRLFSSPPPSDVGKKPLTMPISRAGQVVTTLGLGSLIHLVQTFLSDSGTIIAWTWTGYPLLGPTLDNAAPWVMTVAALGTLCDPSWRVWSILPAGAAVLYYFPDWLGFAGGLILITYLSSLIPQYFRVATIVPHAFGWALALNCVLDVLAVVTTAYAFVPYGWLLRERTDLILLFTVCSVEAGRRAMMGVRLPEAPIQSRHRTHLYSRLSALGTVALALLVFVLKPSPETPVPYSDHRLFTAGIWTVSTFHEA
jgi:hypothetical protein